MGNGKKIEFLNIAFQLPVIPAGRVAAGKIQEIPVGGFIEFLQNLPCRLRAHKLQFALIPDPESGVQADLTVMIADHIQAETVDGLDMVIVKKRHLADGRGILRIPVKGLRHRLADPLPELGGGRVCKCDNQDPVQAERMLPVQKPSEDALYQDGCLSRTRCRGDQEILPPGTDHLFLFIGPSVCHDSPFSRICPPVRPALSFHHFPGC